MWRISACAFVTLALLAQDAIFHTGTQLVTVTVSVTDKNGRPITDMKADEFTLLDDKRPREVESFAQEMDAPLTLGLVVDNTGSQAQFIQQHRKDLLQFLRQVLQPRDRAFLVSIRGPAWLVADVTDSQEDLADATVNRPRHMTGEPFGGDCPAFIPVPFAGKGCGSLIWNGVWGAAKLRLHREQGRKAILLLSDGQDTGSEHGIGATIEAAQGADAPVYTLASTGIPLGIGSLAMRSMGLSRLKRLSEETGGGYFKATKNPATIFAQIEAELRHLYVLSFVLPESDRDGKFHKLTVKSSRPGVRVRARAGYVAER